MALVRSIPAVLQKDVAQTDGCYQAEATPMSRYERDTALCPFYRGEIPKELKIFCEGPHEASPIMIQQFQSRLAYEDVAEMYCCCNYEECPIAITILAHKYGMDLPTP